MTDQERHNVNFSAIASLYEVFRPMVTAFIADAENEGFKPRITSGFRSFTDQNNLYAKGRTAPGPIITNAKGGQSLHNFGLAIDLYDEIKGYSPDWQKLAIIASRHGIEHGDRGYPDLPHFQYRGGLSLEQIQAGERPIIKDALTLDEMKQIEELQADQADLKARVERLEAALAKKSFRFNLKLRNTRKDLRKFKNNQ